MRMTHRPTGTSTADSGEPVAARTRRYSCLIPAGV